jgi:hypothetical protein
MSSTHNKTKVSATPPTQRRKLSFQQAKAKAIKQYREALSKLAK